jgi:hypothetical protein
VNRFSFGTRNATAQADAVVRSVPLREATGDLATLSRRLVENPHHLARLLAELRGRGVHLVSGPKGSQSLLDRTSSLYTPSDDGERSGKKSWSVEAHHKRFAAEVTSSFKRRGDLLFVHLGASPHMTPGAILTEFASFAEANAVAWVIVLDWGGDFGHEHVHSLVLVAERHAFERALGSWAARHRIGSKSRRWTSVTGWKRFRERGTLSLLEHHVARCLAYAEASPPDGRVRNLHRHTVGGGAFAQPWLTFVGNVTRARARSVTRRCAVCDRALIGNITARRRFCGTACRVRNHRALGTETRARAVAPRRKGAEESAYPGSVRPLRRA